MWGVMSAGFPCFPVGCMPADMTLSSSPEIIPPNKQVELDALEARQAQEWKTLQEITSLAKTMDAQFAIPGTPIKVGLDSIVGLIPGIGDTISLGVAGYIVLRAQRMGIGSRHLGLMGFNIFVDWLIGLIPIIGDLFDIGWRGNLRNAAILHEQLEKKWEKERQTLLKS